MYPLTLNALRLACNQSTNRDPVVAYDDAIVRDALHHLERRGFARLASGRRAPKYRHLLAEALPMADDEQAVVCVLMLRGPQTPGELKQRAERMHPFADLSAVHETLAQLIERELAACLERRPGQKEDRYTQLLEDQDDQHVRVHQSNGVPPAAWPTSPSEVSSARPYAAAQPIDGLEERVARLEREVAALRADGGAQAVTELDTSSIDTAGTSSHEPSQHEPSQHQHEPSQHEPPQHEPSQHEPPQHESSQHEPSQHEPPQRQWQ
jgi:uncharacterized protein YceH (UPF0502 family)